MRRALKKRVIEEPVINLTPLIDVVFVILFTFIVVAPLLEFDRIALAGAGEGKESALQNAPFTIHVYSDNSVTINKRPVALQDLPPLLAQAKKYVPDGKIQLFHDKDATFGTFQTIKNALESAGFIEMDVILQPQ